MRASELNVGDARQLSFHWTSFELPRQRKSESKVFISMCKEMKINVLQLRPDTRSLGRGRR